MMKRTILFAMSLMILGVLIAAPHINAVSLKIAPLRYQTTLKVGQKQKGYVDISNPSTQTQNLQFEVQAFRQIDDQANVEFYDDKQVSAGVLLDLESIELRAGDVLRLYFRIDSDKLPSGNVYAAIMARTVPSSTDGTVEAVRVGTILEIANGDGGHHHASVMNFTAPFLQIGDRITAQFTVKNEDAGGTGFRPALSFGVDPYDTRQIEGPLVFSGRSRVVGYSQSGNYFGIVRLNASVDGSSAGAFAFVVTGYWRWLAPMIAIAIISLILAVRYTRHKKH